MTVDHKETVWGPVVTSLIPATNPANINQGYAACHQILRDTTHHTIDSMLGLMRASDWCSARAAMALWRGPGVHMLYGDLQGNIGYTSLVALPIRSLNDPCPIYPGCQPQDGTLSASAWVGEVAFSDHPWSFNPPEGFLVTANNLAADPATTPGNRQFGGPGDTERSWRLRELSRGSSTTPQIPTIPTSKLTPSQTSRSITIR